MKSVQQVFDLGAYDCVSGEKLENVRIGYETYGTLNPDRSNAILVCHYFSGNARAAGPADDVHELPGWWDKAIGPGKALDTDRYLIVSSNRTATVRKRVAAGGNGCVVMTDSSRPLNTDSPPDRASPPPQGILRGG